MNGLRKNLMFRFTTSVSWLFIIFSNWTWRYYCTVNFSVLPYIIIMLCINSFFNDIDEHQARLLMCYLANLTILHICLAVELFYQKKFSSFEYISPCNLFSFLSNSSLIACFCWLYALCNDSYHRMSFYRNPTEVADGSINQSCFKRNVKRRQLFYYFGATMFPLAASAAVAMWVLTQDATIGEFCVFKNPVKSNDQMLIILLPLVFVMMITAGIYIETGSIATHNTETTSEYFTCVGFTHERKQSVYDFTDLNTQAFKVHSFNRFFIYLLLFIVMLISWTLFIAFDSIKPHAVTWMNGLNLISLASFFITEKYYWLKQFYSIF